MGEFDCEVNKIEKGRKFPVFLSVLGSKMLCDLLGGPDKPKGKELVDILVGHFEPRLLVIAKQDQKQDETITIFLSELRRLVAFCSFAALLRDRLVCGVLNEAIQKKLPTEADMTLSL